MRPIWIGIIASFFFAFTFVLNRSMELAGGSWMWSATLRYFFMLPPLLLLVFMRGNLGKLWIELRKHPREWMLWSTVGFGLFYAPFCFAQAYGPGWLIAGTWQITIISGSLLAPFFFEQKMGSQGLQVVRGTISLPGLWMSGVILLGIALMQSEQASLLQTKEVLLGFLPVVLASFAYPLGNRKMMQICGDRVDTYQRVLGMTICSMPFWIVLSVIALIVEGGPSQNQILQTSMVALFSGVCATVLFFRATEMVKGSMRQLAAVEATQSMEVLFATAGEVIWLSASLPTPIASVGLLLIMVGMVLHSLVSGRKEKETPPVNVAG
ncbi:multidrug resistance efflux transporter family protein [Brevibacillus laterosporus]|uniref:Multidrug resistance efflux transporter family protein n=1 Tax=Brevibacillus laterosporus TaxID=1465 RepID=A0A502IP71_BRELA|nr:multidrug resistance efflux transporter family protein [Brevibacillus laterosporus]QDX94959.1 multidrug resistance efflux transporter family protein [Brevibacillus laterosporus]TPG87943.1 multidrug resistance efflux transporter family protein [Brevibacillus laterosporus]